MPEQMTIFDMLYPEKINPVRELIRTTDPYRIDSRRCLKICFVEQDSLLSVVISRMRKLRMISQ